MKKFTRYILMIVAALGLASCAVPDDEFTHDECAIRAIYVSPPGNSSAPQVAGKITVGANGDAEVIFAIPRDYPSRYGYDPSSLTVRANVTYDVFITPGLEGRKDLSHEDKPYVITVSNRTTGESHKYSLFAYVSTVVSGE
ncbi:MAG: hypothetical protein IJM05_00790 [Bacteroidales bacterium]|nr:hypothetical protein [Bacteroidales bacterium]